MLRIYEIFIEREAHDLHLATCPLWICIYIYKPLTIIQALTSCLTKHTVLHVLCQTTSILEVYRWCIIRFSRYNRSLFINKQSCWEVSSQHYSSCVIAFSVISQPSIFCRETLWLCSQFLLFSATTKIQGNSKSNFSQIKSFSLYGAAPPIVSMMKKEAILVFQWLDLSSTFCFPPLQQWAVPWFSSLMQSYGFCIDLNDANHWSEGRNRLCLRANESENEVLYLHSR